MTISRAIAFLPVVILILWSVSGFGQTEKKLDECPILYVHPDPVRESLGALRSRIDASQPLGTYKTSEFTSETDIVVVMGRCVVRNLEDPAAAGEGLKSQSYGKEFDCVRGLSQQYHVELSLGDPGVPPRESADQALERLTQNFGAFIGVQDGDILSACIHNRFPRAQVIEMLTVLGSAKLDSVIAREYWSALMLDATDGDSLLCANGCNRLRWLRVATVEFGGK